MKCFNCNSEIADNNTFCPLCGTSLVQNNNLGSEMSVSNLNSNGNAVNSIQNTSDISENDSIPSVEPANISNVESNPMSHNDFNNIQTMNNFGQVQPNVDISEPYNVGFKEEGGTPIKGKSKMPFIIASVLIIIILAIGGVCAYIFVSSPKKMFVSTIDNSYKFLSNIIDSKLYTSDTISIDFDLKTTNKVVDEEMVPIFNIIKNITLSGKSQIDYKNKKVLVDLDSKYNNSDLINVNTYIDKEKLYFDLNDLYDKKLYLDVEGINEFFKVNEYSNDVINVVNEVKKVITDSLKDEYFKSEKIKMNVNGKEASVDKTILLLNYNNLKVLLNDVLTNLKSNEIFLNSYVNLMKLEDEITKQDVIHEIDDMLNEINEEIDIPEGDIRIILYTKGFNKEFVGFAVENNIDKYGADLSIINDKKNEFTVKYFDGYDEYSAIIKVDGDVYTLYLDQEYEKIEFGLNLKTFDYNFKFIEDEEKMTTSLTTDKDGKKYLSLLYVIDGNEIGIDMTYTIKYNETVTIPTLTPSVEIDSLTEEDGKNILTKMLEKQGIQDLFKEVAKVSGYEIDGDVTIDDIFVSTKIPANYNSCSSAFGCDCDDNEPTCTCNYMNEDGNVASDTIECDNPNYQNCPPGVNCLQSNYNTYNDFSY